jgi:hypothetical protein
VPADRARDGDPIHARQHQVEDDEVEGFLARDQHRFLAIRDRQALVSLDAQMQAHQVADVLFVLDDEHFAGFHFFVAGAPRPAPRRFACGAPSPRAARGFI